MNEQELEDFIDTYVVQQLPEGVLSAKDFVALREEYRKEGGDSNECELESTV